MRFGHRQSPSKFVIRFIVGGLRAVPPRLRLRIVSLTRSGLGIRPLRSPAPSFSRSHSPACGCLPICRLLIGSAGYSGAKSGRTDGGEIPKGRQAGTGAAAGGGNGTAFSDRSAGAAVSFGQSDITEEELSSLDQRDRQMLRSIIDMDYTTVREVMVPRVDMVTIEAGVSLREAAAVIVEHGHSRLPVYVETIDDMLGILYVRGPAGGDGRPPARSQCENADAPGLHRSRDQAGG